MPLTLFEKRRIVALNRAGLLPEDELEAIRSQYRAEQAIQTRGEFAQLPDWFRELKLKSVRGQKERQLETGEKLSMIEAQQQSAIANLLRPPTGFDPTLPVSIPMPEEPPRPAITVTPEAIRQAEAIRRTPVGRLGTFERGIAKSPTVAGFVSSLLPPSEYSRELMQKYPGRAIIGQLIGIPAAFTVLTKGLKVAGVGVKLAQFGNTIPGRALQDAILFGTYELAQEGLRQVDEGKFDPVKLLKEGGKGALYGEMMGAGMATLPIVFRGTKRLLGKGKKAIRANQAFLEGVKEAKAELRKAPEWMPERVKPPKPIVREPKLKEKPQLKLVEVQPEVPKALIKPKVEQKPIDIGLFATKQKEKTMPMFKKKPRVTYEGKYPTEEFPTIGRIREQGGIRPYKNLKEYSEYKELPLTVKNKRGLPPDEMAANLGFTSDVQLYEAIGREIAFGGRKKGFPTPPQKPMRISKESIQALARKETQFEYMRSGGPSTEEIKVALKKVYAKIDVEAPFKEIGAPETGFRIKGYPSQMDFHIRKSFNKIHSIQKANKYNKLEQAKITLLSEKKVFPKTADPRLKAGYKATREYLDSYQKLYAKEGVNVNFTENSIAYLFGEIEKLGRKVEGALKKKDIKEVFKLKTQIATHKKDIARLREMEFTHIPVGLWFERAASEHPRRLSKAIKLLEKRKRKTISIQDLIDVGAIEKADASFIDVIASYGRRAGHDLGLLKIVNNAKKEGLTKSAWIKVGKKYRISERLVKKYESEGLTTLPPWVAGITRGYYHKTPFTRYLYDYVSAVGKQGKLEKVLSSAKMAQFYNPLFLPMYDVIQAGMAGTLTTYPWRSAQAVYKGIRSSIKHDKHYWEALDNAIASKPFRPPYDTWKLMLEASKRSGGAKIIEALKPHPIKRLRDLYHLSWSTAWKLDETVRLMTYHYAKDTLKMTARDAAQYAAKYHSDYASVPPILRKKLNKIFFTPTFKITMGKLYGKMIQGTIKMGAPEGKHFARGALMTAGIVYGFDQFMISQGFTTDQLGRRYFKLVETEEGDRELVVTWAIPANMFAKYFFRAKQAWKPGREEAGLKRFIQMNRWEIHPIWRVGMDLTEPYKNNVYNPFDPNSTKALKSLKYATKEIIRIFNIFGGEGLSGKEASQARKNREIAQREFGKLGHKILSIFAFTYTRMPKETRLVWERKNLQKMFRRMTMKGEWTEERLKEFNKQIEKLIKEEESEE